MTITPLQKLWLVSRGGRDVTDVMEHNGNFFVAMRCRGEWVAVQVLSDEGINREFRIKTDSRGQRLIHRYFT